MTRPLSGAELLRLEDLLPFEDELPAGVDEATANTAINTLLTEARFLLSFKIACKSADHFYVGMVMRQLDGLHPESPDDLIWHGSLSEYQSEHGVFRELLDGVRLLKSEISRLKSVKGGGKGGVRESVSLAKEEVISWYLMHRGEFESKAEAIQNLRDTWPDLAEKWGVDPQEAPSQSTLYRWLNSELV